MYEGSFRVRPAAETAGQIQQEPESKPNMLKKAILLVVLLAGNLFVVNVVYNVWVSERGTPLWECVKGNVAYNFIVARGKDAAKPYTVFGIMWDEAAPSAIIGGKTVKEGAILHGVRIVSIGREEVEFAKNGKVWKQRVGDKPNGVWTD